MPATVDHRLREQIPRDTVSFPVTFFCDELGSFANLTGLLHWHPEFEIATASTSVLDFQAGQQHITLNKGDSIFINANILHKVSRLSGNTPDPMPNIVFSASIIAPQESAIYQKYIRPVIECSSLPFVVFRRDDGRQKQIFGQIVLKIGVYVPLFYRLRVI